MTEERSRIVVRGADITKPALLDTNNAYSIEFYGPNSELIALLVKVLAEGVYALTTKNDPDWQSVLVRYGFLNVNKSIKSIIRDGL